MAALLRYHPFTLLWQSLGLLGKPVQALNHVHVVIVYVSSMPSTRSHGRDTRVPQRFNWPAQASPSTSF